MSIWWENSHKMNLGCQFVCFSCGIVRTWLEDVPQFCLPGLGGCWGSSYRSNILLHQRFHKPAIRAHCSRHRVVFLCVVGWILCRHADGKKISALREIELNWIVWNSSHTSIKKKKLWRFLAGFFQSHLGFWLWKAKRKRLVSCSGKSVILTRVQCWTTLMNVSAELLRLTKRKR